MKKTELIVFEPGAASRVGGHIYTDDVSGSLRAKAGDNQQAICYKVQTNAESSKHI